MGVCTFCNKEKNKNELIEGMNGFLCTDCLTIMKGIDNSNDVTPEDNYKIREKINLNKIKETVDKLVFGQETPKKQLIIELYKHIEHEDDVASNIFLIGDSGVGKTHLVRSLTKIMDVPYIEVDATTFTETGYKGDDVTSILDRIILKEDGDIARVEKSVIFIDEIDKTTTTMNESVSSSKVQEALLKMIEGVEYHYNLDTDNGKIQGVINTKNIMFIVAGACVGIGDIREERLNPNKNSIGFNTHDHVNDVREVDATYIGQDLIDFGFIPEFIGRYSLIIELEPLTKENIHSILTDSPDSIIQKNIDLFESKGIELIVSNEDIEYLVDKVYKSPLGVRGISQYVTEHINNVLYESLLSRITSVHLSLSQARYETEMEKMNIG